MKIYRKQTLAKLLGVSRSTLDRWAHDQRYVNLNFPSPVPLGSGSVGWLADEVHRWLAERAAMRDVAEPEDGGEPAPAAKPAPTRRRAIERERQRASETVT